MEEFLNALWLKQPFTLSYEGDEPVVVISKEVLQYCKEHDMFVLDFLYRSFKKKLNGVILNEQIDMNPQLQVSTFLGAHNNVLKGNFLTLVVCPDEDIAKWHYYMTWCGIFEIKVMKAETDLEEIIEDVGMILLLPFSSIKLADNLSEYKFFSVIIDKFDEVATKMVLRKLQDGFKIGITYRNFYTDPDQKLQWTMLNWANPGSVGKLADFHEIDNDNFAHFRDNYKEWWYRITWAYSESFVPPTLEEKGNLNKILRTWATDHNLSHYLMTKKGKKPKTRRNVKVESKNEDSNSEEDEKVHRRKKAKKMPNKVTDMSNSRKIDNQSGTKAAVKTSKSSHESNISDNSNDTIIYEASQCIDKKDVKNLEVDDNEKNLKKPENSNSKHTARISDDESDVFMKYLAGKEDKANIADRDKLSEILEDEDSKSKVISQLDLELSEQKIVGSCKQSEGVEFLKSVCNNTNEVDNKGTRNNNYASTSASIHSDVDVLIAEAMELAKK